MKPYTRQSPEGRFREASRAISDTYTQMIGTDFDDMRKRARSRLLLMLKHNRPSKHLTDTWSNTLRDNIDTMANSLDKDYAMGVKLAKFRANCDPPFFCHNWCSTDREHLKDYL